MNTTITHNWKKNKVRNKMSVLKNVSNMNPIFKMKKKLVKLKLIFIYNLILFFNFHWYFKFFTINKFFYHKNKKNKKKFFEENKEEGDTDDNVVKEIINYSLEDSI